MTTRVFIRTFKLLLLITKSEAGVTTQVIDFDTRREANIAYENIIKDLNESNASFSWVMSKLYDEQDISV